MSVHQGDAGACVAKHQRAIITASRVAARRRHLAGCQTHWSPPSNSSDQNKGSVRNTDSCNISPGPGSHSISQNTDGEKYFFSLLSPLPPTWIYMNIFGLLPTLLFSLCVMWRKFGKQFSFMLPLRMSAVWWQQNRYIFSLGWVFFLSHFKSLYW